jgi:hypothetical protein
VARPVAPRGSKAPAPSGRRGGLGSAASAGDVVPARDDGSRASLDPVEPVSLPAPDPTKEEDA